MKIDKPELAFFSSAGGAIVSVIIHFLIKFRALPFLQEPTVLSGGREVPTEEFVAFAAPMFLYIVPAFILVGIINYVLLKRRL